MLDRRALLKSLLALGPLAILVPEIILPKRTFFLPPRGGWQATKYNNYATVHFPTEMPIRWMSQYDVANDLMPLRFDAIGILENGDEYHAYVEYPSMDIDTDGFRWPSNHQIESAQWALESKLRAQGAISYRTPPLPSMNAGMAGIIYAL